MKISKNKNPLTAAANAAEFREIREPFLGNIIFT